MFPLFYMPGNWVLSCCVLCFIIKLRMAFFFPFLQSDSYNKAVFSKVMVITSEFHIVAVLVCCVFNRVGIAQLHWGQNLLHYFLRKPTWPREGTGLCEKAGPGSGGRWEDQEAARDPGQSVLFLQTGWSLRGKDRSLFSNSVLAEIHFAV